MCGACTHEKFQSVLATAEYAVLSIFDELQNGEIPQIISYEDPENFTDQNECIFAGMLLVMQRIHLLHNTNEINPSVSKRGVYYHGDCFFTDQDDCDNSLWALCHAFHTFRCELLVYAEPKGKYSTPEMYCR